MPSRNAVTNVESPPAVIHSNPTCATAADFCARVADTRKAVSAAVAMSNRRRFIGAPGAAAASTTQGLQEFGTVELDFAKRRYAERLAWSRKRHQPIARSRKRRSAPREQAGVHVRSDAGFLPPCKDCIGLQ